MKIRGVVVGLIAMLAISGATWADDLVGVASVIDGDTIEIHGARIRFDGIDAPESRQICTRNEKPWRCGTDSANALDAFINRRTVQCRRLGTDRYKRVVGRCAVEDIDLNTWMVQNGWAVDYVKYSGGIYSEAQHAAEDSRAGIWASTFVMPWDWRKGAR